MDRCPHCDAPIKTQPTFTYPNSRYVACLACVSQPSAAEMDDLLMANAITRLQGRRG